MNNFKVAIDGPAGSGKSSICKKICDILGFTHIDTGAMYRAVTLEALKRKINLEDESAYKFIEEITIAYKNDKIVLNGKIVEKEIRSETVNANVSIVSKWRYVREQMVILQQKAAETGLILMDGRDIGTIVLPDANVKIFLTASVEERARRRYLEEKSNGVDLDYEEVLASIKNRDFIDSNRKVNPLRQADDAILLDTTELNIDQVVEKIVKIIKDRMEK